MDKKKVMVVDDEKGFLTMMKLNLEETGQYEVMTLTSAEDILSQVSKFRPDIILLDVLMPKVGGVDACRMLSNDPISRDIPIIIISALQKNKDQFRVYKLSGDELRADDLGVVDYLVKPVQKNDVIAMIEKALGNE